MILAIGDTVQKWVEGFGVSEDSLSDSIHSLLKRLLGARKTLISWYNGIAQATETYRQAEVTIVMLVSELVDGIGSVSEEEDLIVSDFFGNFDGSTINGSEEKASIESELKQKQINQFLHDMSC
jgi:hypothetical protein